jgi:hypothetical protein
VVSVALGLSVVRVAASLKSALSQLILYLRRDAVADVLILALFDISYCQRRLLSDVIKCPANGSYPSARNFFFFSHKVNARKWAPLASGFADVRHLAMCQDILPRVDSGLNSIAGRGNGRICCLA